jgi:alpha-N-arabinofuranosidase
VFAGLSLNGVCTPSILQTKLTSQAIVPKDQLQPYIDDALDEIEFIRGPAYSKWGKVRAKLGHPKPFKLRFVEVGNEDWLAGGDAGWQSYQDYRFPMFLQAINKAYPDIEVIASGSTRANNYTIPKPGAGDYHTYTEPDSLVSEFNYFDNEPTRHLIGEMAAVHPNGGIGWSGPLAPIPWWGGAVGEAVSLLGYERNADRIIGAAYVSSPTSSFLPSNLTFIGTNSPEHE